MRSDGPLAGFAARAPAGSAEPWQLDASLLNGAAGIALVLHAMITDTAPDWDRMMLVDVMSPGPTSAPV